VAYGQRRSRCRSRCSARGRSVRCACTVRVPLSSSRSTITPTPRTRRRSKDFSTPPGAYYDSRRPCTCCRSRRCGAAAAYGGGSGHVRRFRPNVVVSFGDNEGFIEEAWVRRDRCPWCGARARNAKRTERCVITTTAQPGLDRDLEIYRFVAQEQRRQPRPPICAASRGTVSVGETAKGIAQ